MNTCRVCRNAKAAEAFAWHYLDVSRVTICRECQKAVSRASHVKHIVKRRAASKSRRLDARNWVRQQKSRPCFDCGVAYPFCVMQFDHRDGIDKVDDIARLATRAMKPTLEREIAKCDVVCANCHANRTYLRAKERTRKSA